jgi:hypothetical protein
MDGNRAGLVPHKYSKATISKSLPVWAIVLIVLGGVAVLALVIFLICRCRNKKIKRNIDDGSSLLNGVRV